MNAYQGNPAADGIAACKAEASAWAYINDRANRASIEADMRTLADKHCCIKTLEKRGDDLLDYPRVDVGLLKNLLLDAYAMGYTESTANVAPSKWSTKRTYTIKELRDHLADAKDALGESPTAEMLFDFLEMDNDEVSA
jgi:hypothetical protein